MGEEKINKMMQRDETSAAEVTGAGDRGGKAELLRLLSQTRNPVILACNDEMGLWGKGSGWLETRSRFRRLVETVRFDRAKVEDLRGIARRILQAEVLTIDPEGLDILVTENPGDIRALVRDIQAISIGTEQHIHVSAVRAYMSNANRDQHLDQFPGLDRLYRCPDALSAKNLGPHLDTSPDDLVTWVSWNNSSIFADASEVKRGARSLAVADIALPVRFYNRAYRSWYWGGQLGLLSAVCTRIRTPEKVRSTYPDFLRRNNEVWRRNSILKKISETSDASMNSVQRELMPILSAMYANERSGIAVDDFSISMALDLTGEEHALLCGLPTSRNSTKKLVVNYESKLEERKGSPVFLEEVLPEQDKDEGDEPDPAQTTLF